MLCAVFIVEGVTVFQNKSAKKAKNVCIALYVGYFLVRIIESINMYMFTITDKIASTGGIYSATDSEAVVHTLQMALGFDSPLNTVFTLFSFIANFYVLIYMCFMDKNYKKMASQ